MTTKKKTKKETKQIRISLRAYEDIRRRAFKERTTMVQVLETIIWKEFTPI